MSLVSVPVGSIATISLLIGSYLGFLYNFFPSSGPPDAPIDCVLLYLNSSIAEIECIPGYLGGESANFAVYRLSVHGDMKLLDTSLSWDAEKAVLHSEGLEPNQNVTLLIYGENTHGKSDSAVGIYVRTPGEQIVMNPDFLFFFKMKFYTFLRWPSAYSKRWFHTAYHHHLRSDRRSHFHCCVNHGCCCLL
jgi:hypothetical protein